MPSSLVLAKDYLCPVISNCNFDEVQFCVLYCSSVTFKLLGIWTILLEKDKQSEVTQQKMNDVPEGGFHIIDEQISCVSHRDLEAK
ncbi:hypothetical protein chiPu_0012011 [Chiloscyllium punctatum]|uniref:Uncharacterized protein n=1 Tax=Chiloscyllium punctatum TaxID=137246 RepID=A0A401ST27_CHIPU|nr:hypothetical protein [Chiloscyllium punctatum]